MPTPPWHGHLLRGVTEVSRKLRNRRRRGGYFLYIRRYTSAHCMCHAKQAEAWISLFQSFTRAVDICHGANRRAESTFIVGKIYPVSVRLT